MTTTTPAPHGLVNMTNEAYHQAPGISKSCLDQVAKSPLHYWARYVDPNRAQDPPTKAMIIGSAVHAAVLEPEVFTALYLPAPEVNRRTNAGKEELAAFEAEAAAKGATVLDPADYRQCVAIARAVRAHPVAAGLLKEGRAEQSYFGKDPDTGLMVKCRPDFLPDSGIGIVDLKTTEDASPAEFGRSAAKWRYYVQAAFYPDVLRSIYGEAPENFIFIAAEKQPPYAVAVYFCDPDQIALGREKARQNLARIAECQAAGAWPDYGHEPMPLRLPAWAAQMEG